MRIEPLESRRLLALNPLGSGDLIDFGAGSPPPVDVRSDLAANGRVSVAATLRNSHGSQVVLQQFDANGDAVGMPITIAAANFPVGATPTSYVSVADIAVRPNGDTVVLHFESSAPQSKHLRVGMTVVTASKAITGPVTVFESSDANELRDAAVAMSRLGNFFVGYVTADNPQAAQLRIASFDHRGVKRTPRFTAELITGAGDVFGFSSLRMTHNPFTGGVIYALELSKENGASPESDVLWGITSQTGTLTRGQIAAESAFAPSLTIAANGTFAIGYQSIDDGDDGVVNSFVQRFSADGTAAGAPIEVAPASRAAEVRLRDIQRDGNGNLLGTLTTTHRNVNRVYVQTIITTDAARALPSTELALTTRPLGNAFDVGIDDSGAALATYTTRENDFEGSATARRFSPLFAAVNRGTLHLFGTSGDNHLSVLRSGTQLIAFGPLTLQFREAWVERISMLGGNGDDRLDNQTRVPGTLSGGNGNDSLSGGEGSDYLLGGNGNDRIAGNGANDTIYGQDGDDTLFGNADDDRLNGGAGADSLLGGPGVDVGFFDDLDVISSIERRERIVE